MPTSDCSGRSPPPLGLGKALSILTLQCIGLHGFKGNTEGSQVMVQILCSPAGLAMSGPKTGLMAQRKKIILCWQTQTQCHKYLYVFSFKCVGV